MPSTGSGDSPGPLQATTCASLAAKELPAREGELACLAAVKQAAEWLQAKPCARPLTNSDLQHLLVCSLQYLFALSPAEATATKGAGRHRHTHSDWPMAPFKPDSPLAKYDAWLLGARPGKGTVASELLLMALAERPHQWPLHVGGPFPNRPAYRLHDTDEALRHIYNMFDVPLRRFVAAKCWWCRDRIDDIVQETWTSFLVAFVKERETDRLHRFSGRSSVRNVLFLFALRRRSDDVEAERRLGEFFRRMKQDLEATRKSKPHEMGDEKGGPEYPVRGPADLDPQAWRGAAKQLLRAIVEADEKLPPALLGFAYPDESDRQELLGALRGNVRLVAYDYFFRKTVWPWRPWRQSELADKWGLTRARVHQIVHEVEPELRRRVQVKEGWLPRGV
jgi:hypothetical protein